MTRSMTGFARHETNFDWGNIVWEIRSVNHRYLEPHFRLPEHLKAIETSLREQLRKRLGRGKVEVNLQYQANEQNQTLEINTELLSRLIHTSGAVTQKITNSAPLNPLEIMRWPGIIQQSSLDFEQMQADALTGFDQAICKLIDQRSREGSELQILIETRLQSITELVAKVRALMPNILANQKQKILTKIDTLQVEIDNSRLEQELVYLAQKSDVDEELDRLEAHVTEVQHCFKQKGPIGRRLDFLMQELNREANTLSSKSTVSDTTQIAVDLKVLIEQMREQVQNIE